MKLESPLHYPKAFKHSRQLQGKQIMSVTVFVSSTYVDLQPERIAVRDGLMRLGARFSGMEYFGSDPERPVAVCLGWVAKADLYVGIVAHRCGVLVDDDTSMTRREYDEARRLNLPTLIYIKDSSAMVTPTREYVDFEPKYRRLLTEFKEHLLQENAVQFFVNPDELASRVVADVARLKAKLANKNCRPQSHFSSPKYEEDMREAESRLHVIGPPASGKTTFCSVLLHEPAAIFARSGLALEIGSVSGRFYEQYSFLQNSRQCSPTAIHELPVQGFVVHERRTLRRDLRHTVCLADTSGEAYHHELDSVYKGGGSFATFLGPLLRQSTAIALMLPADPSYLCQIASKHDPESFGVAGALSDLLKLNAHLRVAVILTMCDRVPELLATGVDLTDYLERSYPQLRWQVEAAGPRVRVFASAALHEGQDPGMFRIRAFGIWEPFLWMLGIRGR